MVLRLLSGADMVGRHHPPRRGGERSLGIGQEGRDPRERLVLLGIENVKDRADQQRMRGFFPMVAPFERALGVYQYVGNILDVADLMLAAPNLQQRIIFGRSWIGGIEQQRMTEARSPSGRQLPVLALDVVDDRRAGPAQQRRDNEPDALTAAGRGKSHDMLGAVVAQIRSEEHTSELQSLMRISYAVVCLKKQKL